jgi:hypothetical protein
VVAEAGERLSEVGAQFDRQAREAADAATVASQRIGQTGESLRRRADELSGAAQEGGTRLEATADSFRRRAEEVMAAVGQAAARIASVGESFARQSRELGQAMDAAERRIGEAERLLSLQTDALDAAADKATGEANAATEAFRRQADDLAAASAAANEAQARLTASEFEAKRGRFLRASRMVVEGLNSLSIDLARTLDSSVTDRVLKEFLGGDRGVFVRRLLRLDWGSTGKTVQRRYAEDPDFRRYVTDYLTQYDRLIADAREADPENVLVSTFLSADVGKLYMTLASIVGWKKN